MLCSWPGGIGLNLFKSWCNSIIEKTGGELALQPFGAKDVVGDFQLFLINMDLPKILYFMRRRDVV